MGGENGVLGFPITDELSTSGGDGRFNHFENGSIYYKWGASAAYAVYGKIRDKWAENGWENNLGFPLTDELDLPDGSGRYNDFEHARIVYFWGAQEAQIVSH
jgi:uncharacterized protein with LGFP repeats